MKYIFILLFIIITSCNYKNKEKTDDSINAAKINAYLGDYYKQKSIYDSSYLYYVNCERIYSGLNDHHNSGVALYNIGYIYFKIGDFPRSKIYAFKAFSIFRNLDNVDRELYKTYNLLGNVCDELREYDKAIQYHNKALDLAKQEKSLFRFSSLNNLGVVYCHLNKNKKAIACFQQALREKKIQEKPHLYASLQDNLAYSKLKLKEYDELPGLFYKALAIRDSLQIIQGIVINKLHLSEYYQDQKNNDKAVQFAEEAYTIAKEKGVDSRDILLALKQLNAIETDNSRAYFAEYIKISDSIKKSESKLANKIIQDAFDKEELTIEKAQLRKDKKNIIIACIIFISISIITFLIRFFIAKNREFKLKEEKQIANEYAHNMNEEIYSLLLSRSEFIKEQIAGNKRRISDKMQTDLLSRLFEVRVSLDIFNERTDQLAVQERAYYIQELKSLESSLIEISKALKIKEETDNSFVSLLNELFINQNDLKVIFDIVDIKWSKISSVVKVNIYNIVRESVNNINKHSKAKEIIGGVSVQDDNLVLTIIDDGIGFDFDSVKEGSGLKNMRLAAKMLEAVFTIKSSEKGTIVKVKTKF